MSAVQPRTFEQRITSLEEQMLERRDLPSRFAKLESQVLQLRKELRDEFSAIRHELKAGDDDTRVFMRILHEDVLTRIKVTGEGHDTGGKADDQTYPRRRSAEEMEAVFEHLRGWGPEGARIVEVHKKIVALLDAMIDERRGGRRV